VQLTVHPASRIVGRNWFDDETTRSAIQMMQIAMLEIASLRPPR